MNAASIALPLKSRLAALTSRDKLFMAVCLAAAAIFSAYVLSSDEKIEPAVELATAPPTVAPPQIPAPPLAPAQVAAPQASIEGVILQGVMGGGTGGGTAILLLPNGQQRVVRVGREVLPGTVLKEIGVRHAILGSAGGDVRIEMGRAGVQPVGVSARPGRAGGTAPPANHARERIAYRLGMQPVRSGGRAQGYVIKAGAKLPHLERAGLRSGDTILSVNGSMLNEERLMELSWEIANATSTEFEYLRGGRRMKTVLK